MKITEQNIASNEEALKRLNKKLEKNIKNKEEYIQEIDDYYKVRAFEKKSEGETGLVHAIDGNQKRIVEETQRAENKISELKNHLRNIQGKLESEEKNLSNIFQSKLEQNKTQFEESIHDSNQSAVEKQNDIESRNQDTINAIAEKSKFERAQIESDANETSENISYEINQQAIKNERDFRNEVENNYRNHQRELQFQRSEIKKITDKEISAFKRKEMEQKRVQNDQLAFLEKHHKNLLNQKQTDFKSRYEQVVKEHNETINALTKSLNHDLKLLTEKNALEKKTIENKTEDRFYRIEKLSPKVEEKVDSVVISIPVASYEKEHVHLSAQGRNIKITLSRKFQDRTEGSDGAVDHSTRSELYAHEFKVKDLMDPNSITQKYEDGSLWFNVKKA